MAARVSTSASYCAFIEALKPSSSLSASSVARAFSVSARVAASFHASSTATAFSFFACSKASSSRVCGACARVRVCVCAYVWERVWVCPSVQELPRAWHGRKDGA